ncbi:calcium-binding protein [Tropicibacter naphthalenivorans]|uniref:Hemolysin, plasmid n=1 Tax=Tropicibacter naphthalenivorans TaxID=441103 RepID=A0A0P1GGP6_9RHOB|nr:calcium-binding protein [Tropicibacter naphthalenivorans]CUH80799.1 Hemolysin, plasmid [Tropicibacter naphthalenivorans]SMC90278.1 Ca2+-binding protein, RTX toxin-related [Tropicibacter naphthalenivorans]
MATIIDPSNVQDWDEALNTDPMYSATHIFSTNDITATFDGQTQGDDGATFIDFTGANGTKVTQEGVTLYPIDSEFGFYVEDFIGAEDKVIDGDYAEGWAGDLLIDGAQAGLVISDAATDTFKTPATLGTWLTGLGSNTVKASTEHYSVMQNILSDQAFPEDPDAIYQLDDDLILLSLDPALNGQHVSDLINGTATFEGAPVVVTDKNNDGVIDLKDLLNPNESTIAYDIAYSTDYSVTMKDDGKLLYRWGNAIKRPNDVRIEAELPLPTEWNQVDATSGLKSLYQVTAAELTVHHTITNNPNDQIRPEDFENESAIGTLPTYEVIENYNGETGRTVWASTDDYYAGDGTLYPAGTILRDTFLADAVTGTLIESNGATTSDLDLGFTNAWYTTMDREPFEPVLNEDGTEYVTGPRWRLQSDKYGQDLPAVTIPTDPSDPMPVTSAEVKYEVGAETQTVINLLDWATDISPLEISAGWQNNAGDVSVNGLNMTDNFDVAFYIKGDVKPATLYSTEVLLDYQELPMYADGTTIMGTAEADFLVGIGNNIFTGGAGSDLFVLSYGTSASDIVTASVITDFEVGADKLGLIGFDALAGFNVDSQASLALIGQAVSGDDLLISVDGELVATLVGTAADLGIGATLDAGEGLSVEDSFLITNPGPGVDANTPTSGDDILIGTAGDDYIDGLAGYDYISGMDGDDTLLGSEDNDSIRGGKDDDIVDGGLGDDSLSGNAGDDTLIGDEGSDVLNGGGDDDELYGGAGEDWLAGSAGFDTLKSGTGNDSLFGGDDADLVSGQAGDDELYGEDGNDTLYGGGDADTLVGGAGDDWLKGGTEADTFVFGVGDGGDTIVDLTVGEDTLMLDAQLAASIMDGGVIDTGLLVTTFGTVSGADMVLDFGGGDSITLLGSGLDAVSTAITIDYGLPIG